mgnify:CR=1 FL=1
MAITMNDKTAANFRLPMKSIEVADKICIMLSFFKVRVRSAISNTTREQKIAVN